jgi:hypothetical protein
MKKNLVNRNIVVTSIAVGAAALLASTTVGQSASLAASGSKRRVAATVNTTTKVVSAPVVEKKVEATGTWAVDTVATVTTAVVNAAEQPMRPIIPVIAALTVFDCNGNNIPDTQEIANGAPDSDNDSVLDSCEFAMGDLNLNGVIDISDLYILLGWWSIPNPLYGDLNRDGTVDSADLGIILSRYGVVTY